MILSSLPPRVRIVEVAPRDGLQNEPDLVSTESKVAFIDLLSETGVTEVEVSSFVSPKRVPQLASAEEVFRRIRRRPGVLYSALVPNEIGLDRALAAGVSRVSVFTSASESFSRCNINASIATSIERFRPVATRARAARLGLRGYVSTAFHCPFEGPVAPAAVAEVVRLLLDLGVDEVSLGDTIGAAVPSEVERLLDALDGVIARERIALHLHDTRGTGLANALIGLQRQVAIFDTSAGGLGGCPFAPGATGNLATEDLVYMLRGLGVECGIDLAALERASDSAEQALGRPLPSRVRRAGPLRPRPLPGTGTPRGTLPAPRCG
jgi:hydroxymethylglutaryl-CoA lyase